MRYGPFLFREGFLWPFYSLLYLLSVVSPVLSQLSPISRRAQMSTSSEETTAEYDDRTMKKKTG